MDVTMNDGTIAYSYEQDAFGNVLTGSSDSYHLTSKEYDSNIGLSYFYHRWYEPIVGRFLTRTEVSPFLEHPFVYVMNNPMSFVDPSGLDKIVCRGGECKDLQGWHKCYYGTCSDIYGDLYDIAQERVKECEKLYRNRKKICEILECKLLNDAYNWVKAREEMCCNTHCRQAKPTKSCPELPNWLDNNGVPPGECAKGPKGWF